MSWEYIADSKIVEDLGWTLVHSVWQIAVVSIALFFLLALARNLSANLRYALSVSALLFAFLLPVSTFISKTQASSNHAFLQTTRLAGDDDITREKEITLGNIRPTFVDNQIGKNSDSLLSSFSALPEFFPPLLPFIVALWLFGIALSGMRLLGGFWQIRRYKTRGVISPDDNWAAWFAGLCEKLNVKQKVKFLISDVVNTPIAVGIVKPMIIVPAGIFLQINPLELETIVAHELVHIRRFDPLINLLQNIVETVLFYHPCAWWISAQIRREREFAADATVLEIFENSRVIYASALANLEEIRHMADKTLPSIVTAANGGNLMQRIQKILQKNTEISRANSAWTAGLAFLLISAVVTAIFSFSSLVPVNGQSKTTNRKLAVAFVSIPPLDRSENPPKDAVSTAKILVEVLKAHHVPAIGFVQGSMISDGQKQFPVRANIVKMWRDEGFEVGIGGFKHIWFYNTPYDDYVTNAEKNLSVVQPIIAEKSGQLRYFSYPFLNTGKSVEDRDRFESWLKDHGLTSVKYTVDNNEWMYSYAYDMARNDNDLNTMIEIRLAFINYMTKMLDHYETYSREMFGRDIAQTMVLTSSRLVADSAHDLFGMLEKRGYSFVTMSDAQSDPAYQTKEDFVGESGISWFERWRMKQGKPLLDEPKVDDLVQKIWNENKSKAK